MTSVSSAPFNQNVECGRGTPAASDSHRLCSGPSFLWPNFFLLGQGHRPESEAERDADDDRKQRDPHGEPPLPLARIARASSAKGTRQGRPGSESSSYNFQRLQKRSQAARGHHWIRPRTFLVFPQKRKFQELRLEWIPVHNF